MDFSYDKHIEEVEPALRASVHSTHRQLEWIRKASGQDLLNLAAETVGVSGVGDLAGELTAIELGNLSHQDLTHRFAPAFPAGTTLASELADQVQLCRAFADPSAAADSVAEKVMGRVESFPRNAAQLRVGSNPGDVLDPYILAANFELLSERSLAKTIEHTASHKVLMKIEDLIGHLHEGVLGQMRGNFRVPEPQGSRREGKERIDPIRNPFPGADVGQVPLPNDLEKLRLFQVKSKTGSAKGGDGKRLGDQLELLARTYNAETFYVSIVGNTLRGHRSKGAVLRASPNTAVLVGEAALNELTQSKVGAELLLRVYQRAFRAVSKESGYNFSEILLGMVATFEDEAESEDGDFLTAWLKQAVGGPRGDQDSREQS